MSEAWHVSGGPVGFTSPNTPRKYRIAKVDTETAPPGGRLFTTYDAARRHQKRRTRPAVTSVAWT